MLSKDYFHENIEWLRVREVVENAVYSKEMNNKTLEKVQLNRPEFEKALVLIARSSPSMFQELLSKSLNPEGLYEFKYLPPDAGSSAAATSGTWSSTTTSPPTTAGLSL